MASYLVLKQLPLFLPQFSQSAMDAWTFRPVTGSHFAVRQTLAAFTDGRGKLERTMLVGLEFLAVLPRPPEMAGRAGHPSMALKTGAVVDFLVIDQAVRIRDRVAAVVAELIRLSRFQN
jgi:hypothetical protein